MRTFWIALTALSLPMTLFADVDKWRTIGVELTLLSDGSLAVVEHATDLMPEDMTVVKRRYWNDSNEQVKVVRVVLVEPGGKETPQMFDMTSWGEIQIKVPPGGEGPKNFEYRVESLVTGVVIPVWGIRRGVRRMDLPAVVPPLDRLKEIVALWREARSNRFFLDYQFFFPDDQENPDVRLTLKLAPEWMPVHPIVPDAVAHIEKAPIFGYANSLRVSALFDYAGSAPPAAVDMAAHRIRMLSIAAFPILAILIWLAYLGRRAFARPKFADINEQWLREHLLNEAPEVVAARWGTWPPFVTIEQFLRRLERDGKIAIDIRTIDEGTDDEDTIVNLRLRVPREKFSEYERHVIDGLIPTGESVDDRDIQQRYAGTAFDPMESARKWLMDLSDKTRLTTRSPRLSRLFSFVLFATGMALIVLHMTRNHNVSDAAVFFGTLMFLSPLVAIWPSRKISVIWIPLLLMCVFLAIIHSITPQPLGVPASLGVLLALTGAAHAMIAAAAVLARPIELVAAEAWLRSQTQDRKEWRPYREVLGLDEMRADVEEDWGYKLWTFTEKSARPQ